METRIALLSLNKALETWNEVMDSRLLQRVSFWSAGLLFISGIALISGPAVTAIELIPANQESNPQNVIRTYEEFVERQQQLEQRAIDSEVSRSDNQSTSTHRDGAIVHAVPQVDAVDGFREGDVIQVSHTDEASLPRSDSPVRLTGLIEQVRD